MSIIMEGLTQASERDRAINLLMKTTGDTGVMHESFHASNDRLFTRAWFAWAQALFAELVGCAV